MDPARADHLRRVVSYGLAGLLPWAAWYVALWACRASASAGKNPSDYTGTCVRPNGLTVACTYEQWLVWDASPLFDVLTLVGGLAAAAVSGYVYLRYRRARRIAETTEPAPIF